MRIQWLVGSRLGGTGVLFVLFLLCDFDLFGFLLSIPFGLVLLAFLVTHWVAPLWIGSLHFTMREASGLRWPWTVSLKIFT